MIKIDADTSIIDFQLLTDTSGYALDLEGGLYKFDSGSTKPISTPKHIDIRDFYFINENYGAVIGHNTVQKTEGSLSILSPGPGMMIVVLLVLALAGKYSKSVRKFFLSLGVLLTVVGVLVSCSNEWKKYKVADPNSEFVTIIKKLGLSTGYHHFGGNRGQNSYLAITKNGGTDWDIVQVPSNFDLSEIIAVGDNFFIGNYAAENHPDGDIWIFGNDSQYCNLLKENSYGNPFHITAGRGIMGMKHYPSDSILIAFGSDKIFKFPKDENSSTDGNIIVFHTNLQPDYKLIDIPGDIVAKSLSRSQSGSLWVVLANKKLLKFDGKDWSEISVENAQDYKEIEFIPNTGTGYLLTESGEVFETTNEGNDWKKSDLQNKIAKLHSFNQFVTMLTDNNELVRTLASGGVDP